LFCGHTLSEVPAIIFALANKKCAYQKIGRQEYKKRKKKTSRTKGIASRTTTVDLI